MECTVCGRYITNLSGLSPKMCQWCETPMDHDVYQNRWFTILE